MISNPYQVAHEAFVVPSYWQVPGAPSGVHMNTMVLRGAEPVLFDTGIAPDREDWLAATFSVVEPEDVRWVVLSHDDPDHVGNVEAVMAACPNATLVASWFMGERLGPVVQVDPLRLRWVDVGEVLDAGDRQLQFLRPPAYDSPTSRVVFDPVSRALWAGDMCAVPTDGPTQFAEELEPDALAGGFALFQEALSPWVRLVERDRWHAAVAELEALGIWAIASTHGPAFCGSLVDDAVAMLHGLPDGPAIELPGQPVLDEVVAGILARQAA